MLTCLISCVYFSTSSPSFVLGATVLPYQHCLDWHCLKIKPHTNMAHSPCREMANISYLSNLKKTPTHSAREDLITALLAATSRQYTPIVPSPLNPKTCEDDIHKARHIHRLRKARPATRKPPEISPTLRLLRRKAFLANQRVKGCAAPTEGFARTLSPDFDGASAGVPRSGRAGAAMPVFIMDSGPMIQIVHLVDFARNDRAADIEKQAETDLHLRRYSRSSLQRIGIGLILGLMSTCFTFLMVFGLGILKMNHFLAL